MHVVLRVGEALLACLTHDLRKMLTLRGVQLAEIGHACKINYLQSTYDVKKVFQKINMDSRGRTLVKMTLCSQRRTSRCEVYEETTSQTEGSKLYEGERAIVSKRIPKETNLNIVNTKEHDAMFSGRGTTDEISLKNNVETYNFPFNVMPISAPGSVEHKAITTPMSAPLPIKEVSPISLRKFYDGGNDSKTTSPVRGSPISGIDLLPMSEEEPFIDSESSWIPGSDEEITRKRKRSFLADYSRSDDKETPAKKKTNKKLKNKNKPIKKTSMNSSSESENELGADITTNAIIGNSESYNNNEREQSSSETGISIPNNRTVTVDETTECESSAENMQELTEKDNSEGKIFFRWKSKDKSKWKRVIEIEKKRSCLPYTDNKGKMQAPKLPKTTKCGIICRNKCTELFSETQRLEICKEYWAIGDFRMQKEFLLKRVIIKPVIRALKNLPPEKQRSSSREYGFYKNKEFVKVCKNFFTTTLAISNGPIETAVKNINDIRSFGGNDCRGKSLPPNKTSEERVQEVKDHIESFPKKDSHYCRKDTTRQYLSEKLSISKMYELYEMKMKSKNKTPVKLNVYKKIFGSEYNLSFFHPKKDQCCICNRFHRTINPDDSLKKEYEDHFKRKEASFVSKDIDKKRSERDATYLCVTMDLQSLLQVPCTADSLMYYCRKLNLYNLSVYEFKAPDNKAHCIIWTEINGKRGSIEIASAINSWISSIPEEVTEITMYSDTCSGQNRNQYMAAFLMYLVQVNPKISVIEQKYLESGHTFMEVDSMHSAIEKEKRYSDVFSVIDWKGIMHRARSSRHNKDARPYHITELSFRDMIDVKTLASKTMKNRTICTDGSKVNWLKIKCLRFEKALPGVVQLRYNYDGPYLTMDTTFKIGRGRQTRSTPAAVLEASEIRLEKAYKQALPISEAKKKDLLNLCKKNIIPEELHPWYENLPSTSHPVINDSDSE